MKIRDIEIDIDVYDELMNYEWKNGRKKGDEYVCCSPFRDEEHPSFSINLESGLWIDFGGSDDDWKKGNLVKLVAYMEAITFEEAEEMLLTSYGITLDDAEYKDLIINIQEKEEEERTFSRVELKPYLIRTSESIRYIWGRGIADEIMRKFVVGYDKEQEAVAFFWRDWKTGKVVNVKFRKIKSKIFYYADGQQIKNHLYGLYDVIKGSHKEVFLVESEIDCLYLWSLGFPAVALGGSNFSEEQKRKLLLSGIETLIIATDRDKAGWRIRKQIERELGGLVNLKNLHIPSYANDVNDLAGFELKEYASQPDDLELKII
ncbi:toprim domain-containing protein [Cytobacillus firmus]|nr:toprim domain-containing protein [Cytobacillus firmus]